jgi:hypothetical protein
VNITLKSRIGSPVVSLRWAYAITWHPSSGRRARFVTAGAIDPKLCTYVRQVRVLTNQISVQSENTKSAITALQFYLNILTLCEHVSMHHSTFIPNFGPIGLQIWPPGIRLGQVRWSFVNLRRRSDGLPGSQTKVPPFWGISKLEYVHFGVSPTSSFSILRYLQSWICPIWITLILRYWVISKCTPWPQTKYWSDLIHDFAAQKPQKCYDSLTNGGF